LNWLPFIFQVENPRRKPFTWAKQLGSDWSDPMEKAGETPKSPAFCLLGLLSLLSLLQLCPIKIALFWWFWWFWW
jgi:hypothetical protein